MTDLSGRWDGNYGYPGSLEPVPFTIELRDTGGKLVGETSEPAPRTMQAGEVSAIISGVRNGNAVHFTKIYDSLDHFLQPVGYRGTLDEDECEISGTWSIPGDWSGPFVMTRPKPERAQAEAIEKVELPLGS